MINIFYLLIDLNITLIIKIFNKRKKLTKFSILKSPHVHKIAQLKVGFKIYKKQIVLSLFNFINLYFYLK